MGEPLTGDKERENGEVIHHIQIGHLLHRTNLMEEMQEVSNCFGICLCPYLIFKIITFKTRIPVVIQTSLCIETLERETVKSWFLFAEAFPPKQTLLSCSAAVLLQLI